MRRALLLLPVVLVTAVLAALRGCADDPHGPHDSPLREAAADAAVEAAETAGREPDGEPRRRTHVVPGAEPAASASPAKPEDASDTFPRLTGRVTTADGRPLAGCVVAEGPLETDFDVEIASPPLGAETRTDEDGRFSLIAVSDTSHTLEVRVPLAGRNSAVLERRGVTTEDEISVVVPPVRIIEVTLVTPGGEPVPSTVVVVTTPARSLEDGTVVQAGTQRAMTGSRHEPGGAGRFRVCVLDGARPAFALPEHASLTLASCPQPPQGATEIVLVATEGAAIEGVCVDQDGEPVSGAAVSAKSRLEDDPHVRIGTADDAGRFRLTGLTPGATYAVRALQHNQVDAELDREVAAGATDVRLTLLRSRTLNGVLRTPRGDLAGGGVLVLRSTFRGLELQYEVRVLAGRFLYRGIVGTDIQATFRPAEGGGDEVDLGPLPDPGPEGLVEIVLPD